MKSWKKGATLLGFIAVASFAASSAAFAAGGMLKHCKKELKEFSCEAKTEAAAHECLEQHEAHDKKHDGFSPACYKAHESFEKKMHKEEKGEKEHDEGAEHSGY